MYNYEIIPNVNLASQQWQLKSNSKNLLKTCFILRSSICNKHNFASHSLLVVRIKLSLEELLLVGGIVGRRFCL